MGVPAVAHLRAVAPIATAMRIAIATDWFAPRPGGIETQLLELAQRLSQRGHSVDVLTSTPRARRGSTFRVVPLDVARLPGVDVAISPALVPLLSSRLDGGYDVVHAHVSVVSPVGYLAALVARRRALPTVLTFHSVLRFSRQLLRAAHEVAGVGSSGVVWSAVSEQVAAQVRSAVEADTVVLPNGIDVDFWRSAVRVRTARDANSVVLVSAMRLHRKKRPTQLVRAFQRATRRAAVHARLIIAGDGPERAAVEREALTSRNEFGEVEFAGWRDREALRALYATADAFVLASRHEAFGIAALEARASGVPVIAFDSIGARELLSHDANALLCRDDDDLSRQLERFLGDGSLRRRLAAGEAPVERYDWSRVIALHEATYRRAMSDAAQRVAAR